MGDLETRGGRYAPYTAGQDAEAGSAVFFAVIKQHLHAKANAQKGFSQVDRLSDSCVQATVTHVGHGETHGADAGQDDRIRSQGAGRTGCDFA